VDASLWETLACSIVRECLSPLTATQLIKSHLLWPGLPSPPDSVMGYDTGPGLL
jgi:hypothetical protein